MKIRSIPRLDPIIGLAVGMATSPGAYAFLLGSGVSLEAGVPTGEQILRDTQTRLFRIHSDGQSAGPGELDVWLESQGLLRASYSDILAAAFPAIQSRRDFLARFFEGRGPGPTHVALARLAASGLIRIFITTNFDALLEIALRAEGLHPIMVSDAASLESAPSRETVDVFVLKAHGDAGQLTIRNTPEELERLESRTEQELMEICQRYGIVALGWSGRDPAVAAAVARTSARFGLYWLSRRSQLTPEAQAIVDVAQGHVVVRDGARDFVEELERRAALWRAHPTGQTPTVVRAELITGMRDDDPVGVAELLGRERHDFERAALGCLQEAGDALGYKIDLKELRGVERDLAALMERRWATGFALITHGWSFADEAQWVSKLSRREILSPVAAWRESPRWLAWMLVHSYGVAATALRRFRVLHELWDTQEPDEKAGPLAAMRQLSSSQLASALYQAREDSGTAELDGLWHLAHMFADSELIRAHYPELLTGGRMSPVGNALDRLGELSYLLSALGGRDGVRVVQHWQSDDVKLDLIARMKQDRRLAADLTELFGAQPGGELEVGRQIADWCRQQSGPTSMF